MIEYRIVCLGLALTVTALPAFSTTLTTVSCSALYISKDATSECSLSDQRNEPYPASGSAVATATSNYGILKAYSYANGAEAFPSSSATAYSQYTDHVTISERDGSHSDTLAYVSFLTDFRYLSTVFSENSQAVGTRGVAFASYTLGASSALESVSMRGYDEHYFGQQPQDNQHIVQLLPSSMTLAINLGTSFSINAYLEATTALQGNGSAMIDASHSAYWGGISSVTNQFGESIDYVLSSNSGTDWSRSFSPAVPEPESYVLMLLGLAVLSWGARRKRF